MSRRPVSAKHDNSVVCCLQLEIDHLRQQLKACKPQCRIPQPSCNILAVAFRNPNGTTFLVNAANGWQALSLPTVSGLYQFFAVIEAANLPSTAVVEWQSTKTTPNQAQGYQVGLTPVQDENVAIAVSLKIGNRVLCSQTFNIFILS
jgi:hypothetical protein